ncbi:MAG TPA: serine/threonine-protein kinase [Candidatus Thermoplasmatota archaeon]|nr:serine/threonine-protein kinase [Candidatus Thermoplasmatota archaeon]
MDLGLLRFSRRPEWRSAEGGRVEFHLGGESGWQSVPGWGAPLFERLCDGARFGELVDALAAAGVPHPERTVRFALYEMHQLGYLELPADDPPAVYAQRWERLEELGRGGVAIVDLCRDRVTGRLVGVKRSWDLVQPRETTEAAIRREADTLARLDHPGIVRLVATFERDGRLHVVRDFVEGRDLFRLRDVGIPDDAALRALAVGLVDLVAHIHGRGFLVLDLRPANFLRRDDGVPVLLDVGTCREAGGKPLTLARAVGSPGFTSPEMRRDRTVDVASDVFGFGRLLGFLADGRPPRDEDAPGTSRARQPWRGIVEACTAEEPAKRPQDMAEVRRLLEQG